MAACPGDPSGSVPAQDLPERNIVMDAGGPNPADGSADMGTGPVDASARPDGATPFPDTFSDPGAMAETDSDTASPADAIVTDSTGETDLDALGELQEVSADVSLADDGVAPPDALPPPPMAALPTADASCRSLVSPRAHAGIQHHGRDRLQSQGSASEP